MVNDQLTGEDREILNREAILLREEADGLSSGPICSMFRKHATRLRRVTSYKSATAKPIDTSACRGRELTPAEVESIKRVLGGVLGIYKGVPMFRDDEGGTYNYEAAYDAIPTKDVWHFSGDGITTPLIRLLPPEPVWDDGAPPPFAEVKVPGVYVKPFREIVWDHRNDWMVERLDDETERVLYGFRPLLAELEVAPDDQPAMVRVMTGEDGAGVLCRHMQHDEWTDSPFLRVVNLLMGDRPTREKGRELLDAHLAVVDQLEAIAA